MLTTDTAGIYGWVALGSRVINAGYFWDDKSNGITWLNTLGSESEGVVTSQGGGQRYNIQVPVSSAPSYGEHVLKYVLWLENGQMIVLECWKLDVQPAESAS